jgi:hypothetical protein
MAKTNVRIDKNGKIVYRDSATGRMVSKDSHFPANRTLKQGQIPKKERRPF